MAPTLADPRCAQAVPSTGAIRWRPRPDSARLRAIRESNALPSPLPSPSHDPAAPPRALRSAFLVGAPRCGTTFLAKLLARHPEVCFSKPKETHFFVRDAPDIPPARWREEFLRRHFGHHASGEHLLIEGSPLQLRDPAAIRRLLQFDPEARFVVALRSPIDMVQSLHARLVFLLDEDERDLERAWALQGARARGERLPRRCRDRGALQYRAMASLGSQLERLYGEVDRKRVHVVVFDDLAADAAKTYLELLAFLDLPDDGRRRFRPRNESRRHRFDWLQTALTHPPRPVAAWLAERERRGEPRPEWVRALRRSVKRWNTIPEPRPALSPAMFGVLRSALEDEVRRLEALLGRDLSHWLSEDARTRFGRPPGLPGEDERRKPVGASARA